MKLFLLGDKVIISFASNNLNEEKKNVGGGEVVITYKKNQLEVRSEFGCPATV